MVRDGDIQCKGRDGTGRLSAALKSMKIENVCVSFHRNFHSHSKGDLNIGM